MPMALTVVFALLGSLILSLTYVPAMPSIILCGKVSEKESFLIRWAKQILPSGACFCDAVSHACGSGRHRFGPNFGGCFSFSRWRIYPAPG